MRQLKRITVDPYFGGPRIRYPRRKRESVYRWIQELTADISIRAGKQFATPVTWRRAAKQWLVKNGLIKIQKAGKVSPTFLQKMRPN